MPVSYTHLDVYKRQVLNEAGKLNEAERTLRWYAITNEVYPKPTVNGIDIDLSLIHI